MLLLLLCISEPPVVPASLDAGDNAGDDEAGDEDEKNTTHVMQVQLVRATVLHLL